ncbi:Molybdenum cofactor sulfurase [Venturia nashicola]|uniref:Molybdenum cofactor sulfurase n=1 Tax=Venturia nashicola TaxID=86259 RepID=A0A4Z1NLJ2_9PEZI|nr:Molybdenum cofactor sulfurase [Venturia nashicola]TLD25671.1 Molybdenum cofactor sulfurase [Venturia nashicola]
MDLNHIMEEISSQIQQIYSKMEFTAGGVFLYLFAFLMLILPLVIFGFESLTGKVAAPTRSSTKIPKPPPTKIQEIRIYPIKSCRGLKVQKTKLLKTGLDLDRNWMFAEASTLKFLTIRQISDMTLIDTKITDDDTLEVSISTKPNINFSIPAHPNEIWLSLNTELVKDCEIWGQKVDGYLYSKDLTAPFSEFFGKDVRLVYKGPTPRPLKGNADPQVLGRVESTKFADLMPIQVSNQKSIEELNYRLKSAGEPPISIERFRPNIVVEGEEPWYEDVWKTVRLQPSNWTAEKSEGDITMDVAARCARCQVPNVDPDTGVKNKKQPWNKLMEYRRVDEGITFKPCFGMLCVPREEGEISVGDTFEITEVTGDHKYIPGM